AYGLRFAPDPSSQRACTVGGNIAENSGGPHCFLHGMTTRHILEVRSVLSDGSIVQLKRDGGGIDWRGAFIGSEGTFGVTVQAKVRLVPRPQKVRTFLVSYTSLAASCEAVTSIIAKGLRPAALEILDRLTIQAVEASVFRAGYPVDAEAVLLIELEGLPGEVDEAAKEVRKACSSVETIKFEEADDPVSRERLWRGRKGAFGAMGRIASDLYVLDAVVPRTRLAAAITGIQEIGHKYEVVLSNVFHAGDGNLHPNISFDAADPEQRKRVLAAGDEILQLCVDLGGTLSGEHGIGLEKRDQMPLIFSAEQMETQRLLRRAVDPQELANPGKILPIGRGCVEAGFRGLDHIRRTEQVLGTRLKNKGVPPEGDTP
ncbi:MAG: FAD-linked oxidase C-terminal domain-containing protein, partial [Planctomycetota bacterium]